MANSYLNRVNSSSTVAERRQFTISVWLKRSGLGYTAICSAGNGGGSEEFSMRFDTNNKLDVFHFDSSSYVGRLTTTRRFRDTSAWYHIVFQYDSPNSTAGDRMKLYVNGVEETAFDTDTNPTQNDNNAWNVDERHQIGSNSWANSGNGSNFFDGYISHFANVAGSIVAPTSFGETDSTSGIWKFKPPSGVNFGTNGFHLKFENSGNLGLDSANSNNFTTQGNLKQSLSTPSTIYGTLSNQIVPWASSTVATNGNTTITCPSGTEGTSMVTIGVNTGKWYCEMKQGDSNDVYIGVGAETFISDNLLNAYSGATHNATTGLLVKHSNGTRYVNGSSSSGIFASTGSGDVTGIALDLDAATRTVTFYKNGVVDSAGAQNLPTNMQSGFLFPVCMVLDNSIVHLNTGDGFFGTTAITSAGSNGNGSLFEFDCPANHYAINTKNLNTYG